MDSFKPRTGSVFLRPRLPLPLLDQRRLPCGLPCHPKVNLLDRTIIREKQRPLDSPGQPQSQEAQA